MMTVETYTKEPAYDTRHGGAYDRGAADSYYRRPYNPHMYAGATATSPRIEMAAMTAEEIVAYTAGYRDNEASGMHKEGY